MIAKSSELALDERRIKNNHVVKVVRKSHDDYRRRCGSTPFVGVGRDRDKCQRDDDGDSGDRTSVAQVAIRSPERSGDNGSGGDHVRDWERPVWVTCDFGEKLGNVDGPVDWTKLQASGETVNDAANGYHPVRRRLFAEGEGDKTVTAAVDDTLSPEDRQRHSKQQWFGNCWRPKLSSMALGIHQHHHRRVYRHRHHHHHTHRLHMWTSSCYWWLLVFYAVVVVVASFARAAHSAKDGKFVIILYSYLVLFINRWIYTGNTVSIPTFLYFYPVFRQYSLYHLPMGMNE